MVSITEFDSVGSGSSPGGASNKESPKGVVSCLENSEGVTAVGVRVRHSPHPVKDKGCIAWHRAGKVVRFHTWCLKH